MARLPSGCCRKACRCSRGSCCSCGGGRCTPGGVTAPAASPPAAAATPPAAPQSGAAKEGSVAFIYGDEFGLRLRLCRGRRRRPRRRGSTREVTTARMGASTQKTSASTKRTGVLRIGVSRPVPLAGTINADAPDFVAMNVSVFARRGGRGGGRGAHADGCGGETSAAGEGGRRGSCFGRREGPGRGGRGSRRGGWGAARSGRGAALVAATVLVPEAETPYATSAAPAVAAVPGCLPHPWLLIQLVLARTRAR